MLHMACMFVGRRFIRFAACWGSDMRKCGKEITSALRWRVKIPGASCELSPLVLRFVGYRILNSCPARFTSGRENVVVKQVNQGAHSASQRRLGNRIRINTTAFSVCIQFGLHIQHRSSSLVNVFSWNLSSLDYCN
jgi:hypothetical protein